MISTYILDQYHNIVDISEKKYAKFKMMTNTYMH